MPEVAPRGTAPGTGRCLRSARRDRGLLDLGHRALQVLERQLPIVKRALLRALAVDRPAQLLDQVFQAAVGVGEQRHLRTQLTVGLLLPIEGRLLRLEQRPVSFGQRLGIDRLTMGLHDRILS